MSFDDILNNNPLGIYAGAIIFVTIGIIKFITDSRKDRAAKREKQEEDDNIKYVEKIKTELCEDINILYSKCERIVDKEDIKDIQKSVGRISDRVSRLEGKLDNWFNDTYRPQTRNGNKPGGDY